MRQLKAQALSNVSAAELSRLVEPHEGPCASFFLPVEWAHAGALQAPIRLKNLLAEAEAELTRIGERPNRAKEILAPVAALRDDGDLWRNGGGGIAAFAAPDFFACHLVPGTIEQSVTVGPVFHIRPLLPFAGREGPFFALALSEKSHRLLRCLGARVSRIDLPDAPRDVDDANRFEDPERQVQFHTRTAGGSPGGARRPAMFHGQGGARDAENTERRTYTRLIAKSVLRAIGSENIPLILAGAEPTTSAFRAFNEYPHLLDETAAGNPDDWSDDEVRKRAWPLVEPYFAREANDAIERFHQSLGVGLASANIEEIVRAAHQGRVGILIVTDRAAPKGRVDLDTGDARFLQPNASGAPDFVDYAATLTLKNGGRVLWSRAEDARLGDAPAAAIFRY